MSQFTKRHRLTEKVLKLINALEPTDKLVRVKSWRPYIDEGSIYWPAMLIDYLGKRATVIPQWTKRRIFRIFKRY